MKAGRLREKVALDAETVAPDGYGGETRAWVEQFVTRAEFRYQRGKEAMQAGGLTGQATFKVRIKSSIAARAVTQGYRLRDVREGVSYNITKVDKKSDPRHVWIECENGVAV